MELQTLGGLWLHGAHFTQPKPLVLLTYLALEGPQVRPHLAELFWPNGESRKSLSMALTRLRQATGEVVATDANRVWTTLACDAGALLLALGRSDWQEAATHYRGAFMEGVVLDWSTELEEWVYTTREFLAERVRHGLLTLAEDAARAGTYSDVLRLAEEAYHLPGAPPAEAGTLERHYRLLVAGESVYAPKVRSELAAYGLDMNREAGTSADVPPDLSPAAARASFRPHHVPSSLPPRTTTFVGRERELRQLGEKLADPACRLLTLLGSAGIGKTRLALTFAQAEQSATTYTGGVYFAALETARSDTLPEQIALALGHTLNSPDDPVSALATLLGTQDILVVLDNFEHLEESAPLLSALVGRCPGLKLLVTSRVRLALPEEHLFLLDGLVFPERRASPTEASSFDAVQLFGQRARQLRPDFDLEQELPAVLELCALLGGSPLGLELAAAWVRFMSSADIVRELRQSLDFLTSSAPDTPERHRSLRAAFDYSWTLLSGREQETLAALAVFRGGFTRQAASEVLGATIPTLVALLDRSLLRLPSGSRFEAHPLISQYAGEKLRERAELRETTSARHAAYFLALARGLEAAVQAGQQDAALRDLESDWANIWAAFEYSLERRNVDELGRALELLELLHDTRGSYGEALAFLERAEMLLHEPGFGEAGVSEILGGLYSKRAWFELRLGRYDHARHATLTALQLLPEASPWRVSAYNTLSILERRAGAYGEAKEACETGLELARQHDELDVARMLASLADVEEALGDISASEAHFLEAIALYRKHRRVLGVVRNLNNLGWLYYVDGRLERAEATFSEGLRLARAVDYRQTLPYLLNNLGYIALGAGRYDEAQRLNEEALELVRQNGERAVEAEVLAALARGALALGQPEAARRYLLEGLQHAWDVAYVGLVLQVLLTWGEYFCAVGARDKALGLALLVDHHPATTELEHSRVTGLLQRLGGGTGVLPGGDTADDVGATRSSNPSPNQHLEETVMDLLGGHFVA